MMRKLTRRFGMRLANFLNKPSKKYQPFAVHKLENLRKVLKPGDVLLVEGNLRISVAIKYLTQSTWSHAALYIGEELGQFGAGGEPLDLVEADLTRGVQAVPLSTYQDHNTRICRAENLSDRDLRQLLDFTIKRIGYAYDLKNVIDLLRYLMRTPPVPVRWRRRMIALGSGDPSRAICSTLIAQAFQSIGYPILPETEVLKYCSIETGQYLEKEIKHIRHHSLYTPRDFDISPFFAIVKPTLANGFDYRSIEWRD